MGSHPKGSQGLSGVYPKPQTPVPYLGTRLGLSDAGNLEAASEVSTPVVRKGGGWHPELRLPEVANATRKCASQSEQPALPAA